WSQSLCQMAWTFKGGRSTFNVQRSTFKAQLLRQPEELSRGGKGIGVRARCAGNVREQPSNGGRGLQIETGVGPAQHQLIIQLSRIENRRVAAEKARHIVARKS